MSGRRSRSSGQNSAHARRFPCALSRSCLGLSRTELNVILFTPLAQCGFDGIGFKQVPGLKHTSGLQQLLEATVGAFASKEARHGVVVIGQLLIDKGQNQLPTEVQIVFVRDGDVPVGCGYFCPTPRKGKTSSAPLAGEVTGQVSHGKRSANPPCAVDDGVLKMVLRDGGECRSWCRGVAGRAPVMRQQLREIALLECGQTLEHVLEVGPRIVPVEFG